MKMGRTNWEEIWSQFLFFSTNKMERMDSNAALECYTQVLDSHAGPNYAQSPAALKNKYDRWLALKQLQ
jgi:hypothetical protein